MRNKREPEVRKSGDAASSRRVAPKPAADAAAQLKRPAPADGQASEGKNSKSGAAAVARKRRKPFVL